MLRLLKAIGLTIAIVLTLPVAAMAHGIPMAVDADDSDQLFAPNLVTYDPVQSQLTYNGTLDLVRGTAAFYPVFEGGIPAGTALNVDIAGNALHPAALLYWDGASVLPSPVSISLTRTGVNALVSPTDTFVTGGALGAYNGTPTGHSSLTVSLPPTAPAGLYAIGFQVYHDDFQRSETFWGVANYGVAADDVPAGLAAIGSAVPEPSTISLAVLALPLAVPAALRWVRRRRQM